MAQPYQEVNLEEEDEENERGSATIQESATDEPGDMERGGADKGAFDARGQSELEELPLDETASLLEKIWCLVSMSMPISLGYFLNLGTSFIILAFAGSFHE